MKYLIWNDEPEALSEWESLLKKQPQPMEPEVKAVSDSNIDKFINTFKEFNPDVLLLDIVANEGDRVHGINIARAIRLVDKLVPILAITKEPSTVYQLAESNEAVGFAGVYHATIMEKGAFWMSALRPSLNNWSLMAPEYTLIRQVVVTLNKVLIKNVKDHPMRNLVDKLAELPLHGDLDAWHKDVSDEIRWQLEREFLKGLGMTFLNVCGLFQKADPFYMASTSSRKHLSHNVQVFLLGVYVLLNFDELKHSAINQIKHIEPEIKTDDSCLTRAILIWACVALTHDVGYLSEVLGTVCKDLLALGQSFKPALSGADCILDGLKDVYWPKVDKDNSRNTHPEIGKALWESGQYNHVEAQYAHLIGEAIARHDSKISRDKSPLDSTKWLSFLAVLCDELQDWGRTRSERFKNWRLFALEHINIRKTQKGTTLNMLFAAVHHPPSVNEKTGSGGSSEVMANFRYSMKNIRDNLRASSGFEVVLKAAFPTRPDAADVRESVTLQIPCAQ